MESYYNRITDQTGIPSCLYQNNQFLSVPENVDMLCKFIVQQENIVDFAMASVQCLNEEICFKILQAFAQKTTIGYISFVEAQEFWFASDANVEMFVECLKNNQKLKEVNFERIQLSDSQAFKVLEALSQLKTLKYMFFESTSSWLKTEANVELFCQMLLKQASIPVLQIGDQQLSVEAGLKMFETMYERTVQNKEFFQLYLSQNSTWINSE